MLADLFISLINLLIDGLVVISKVALSILPSSPFKFVVDSNIEKYLGYLNWVIPINVLLTITLYWLSAICIYYVVSVVLRWVKLIQ